MSQHEYDHLTGGPAAPTTQPAWAPPPNWQEKPKKKRRGLKITGLVITAGLASLITIGVATQNSGSASSADTRPAPSGYNTATPPASSNPFGDSDPTNDPNYNGDPTELPAAPAAPTVSQEQALESAQSYLDMGTGFSRAGLLDQLHSSAGEGFPMADAKWAVNHTHANWNHQAVLSAKGYLDMGGFSRASLIDQLSSSAGEGFTVAQATYAANQVGL